MVTHTSIDSEVVHRTQDAEPGRRRLDGRVKDFDHLIAAALVAPFEGWNLSWLKEDGAKDTAPTSNDSATATGYTKGARTMFDTVARGGEMPSRIPRSLRTVAIDV